MQTTNNACYNVYFVTVHALLKWTVVEGYGT